MYTRVYGRDTPYVHPWVRKEYPLLHPWVRKGYPCYTRGYEEHAGYTPVGMRSMHAIHTRGYGG